MVHLYFNAVRIPVLSRPSLLDEIHDEVPWATAEDLRRVAQTSFSRQFRGPYFLVNGIGTLWL